MHLTEDKLEQYAMGRLPELAVRDFECHLLVCYGCQDRMAEMDAFVAGGREACRIIRTSEPKKPAAGHVR